MQVKKIRNVKKVNGEQENVESEKLKADKKQWQ